MGQCRDADLDQHLPHPDVGLVRAPMEVLEAHLPLAMDPLDHTGGPDRGAHRRQILGRVRLAQRTPDRPPVTHDGVGDHPLGVMEDGKSLPMMSDSSSERCRVKAPITMDPFTERM
jgi:hypothetical protein